MAYLGRMLGKRDLSTPEFDFSTLLFEDDTPMLREIQRLRYEVYCLERGFINPAQYPEGRETDQFDPYATHFAAHESELGLVGTVRLVRPPEGMPYPFKYRIEVFDNAVLPPRDQAAEISRLIVKKCFRRRRADSIEGMPGELSEVAQADGVATLPSAAERRGNSPLLLLGLYREMYRHSLATGIRYWYAAMERALAHSLSRMSMGFTQIGPQSECYGTVALHVVDLRCLEQQMNERNPKLFAWFSEDCPAYPQALQA